jgi:hypothetical protein
VWKEETRINRHNFTCKHDVDCGPQSSFLQDRNCNRGFKLDTQIVIVVDVLQLVQYILILKD